MILLSFFQLRTQVWGFLLTNYHEFLSVSTRLTGPAVVAELALAISRHLVQAHGGQIWAKSKEGKGSTFYFSLPLAGHSNSD